MKKAILIFSLACAVMPAVAQQLHTSSLTDMQGLIHNPSTQGVYQHGTVGATYRSQWGGVNGGPKTAMVFGSFDLPSHNIGLGGHLYNDRTGPTSRTGIQLAFAKHIPLKNDARFSLGIEARGHQFSIDKAKLMETLGSNDPVLAGSDNKFKFDAGFGVSYTSKKFHVGASVAQLIQSKLGFYTGSQTPSEEGRLYRHYYLHGMYHWNVDGETVISPNMMFIYLPNAPLEFQGGVRVEHNELFWWGVAFTANKTFNLSAGVDIKKKFTIGYAFDIYNTPLSIFEGASNAHEILLRYNISK